MSYIDGYFDRQADIIRVVEDRTAKEYSKNIQSNTHSITKIQAENIKVQLENLSAELCVKTLKTFTKN